MVFDLGMDLVTRGRLSVQRVTEDAWDTVASMSEKGGWEEMNMKSKKVASAGKSKAKETGGKTSTAKKGKGRPKGQKARRKTQEDDEDEEDGEEEEEEEEEPVKQPKSSAAYAKRKREVEDVGTSEDASVRRSTRRKK